MSNLLTPRPILKRSCSAERSVQNAVHFPPSPSLTRTFSVHSAASYDRSPIVVDTNSCAMPERGCPGRTYALDDSRAGSAPSMSIKQTPSRGHAHPRAWASSNPPPLVLDLSSESDESDGLASPPLLSCAGPSISLMHPNTDSYIAHAARYPYSQQPLAISPSAGRTATLRKRRSPTGSPSFSMLEEDDPGYDDDDDDTPTPSSSPIMPDREKRRSKRTATTALSRKLSSFKLEDDDDGCLGGF